MTNTQTLILVAALAFSVAGIGAIVAALTRRGVDMDAFHAVLTTINGAMRDIDSLRDTLSEVLSDDMDAIINNVLSVATIAVGNAEQLYNTSQLTEDERKPAAMQYIRDTLALAGVIWTDDIAKLADGAIEAAVLALGHAEKTVAPNTSEAISE